MVCLCILKVGSQFYPLSNNHVVVNILASVVQNFILAFHHNCRCEATLGEFLRGIGKSPGKANYAGMINILIAHSHSPGNKSCFLSMSLTIIALLETQGRIFGEQLVLTLCSRILFKIPLCSMILAQKEVGVQ